MLGFKSSTFPIFQSVYSKPLCELNICDIGVNILDDMYDGVYNGKKYHENDIVDVLNRGVSLGLKDFIFTGTTSGESKQLIELTRKLRQEHNLNTFSTVGIHPTRCNEFLVNPEQVINELDLLIEDGIRDNVVVAIGECGLDYDREKYCKRAQQLVGFQYQLDLSYKYELPLFLHSRNTDSDFIRILLNERNKIKAGGVIHSFTGTLDEMKQLVNAGFYIGINGCSLKTDDNLIVASEVPSEYLLIETDCPWCSVKSSHVGHKYLNIDYPVKKKEKYEMGCMVKDRCEPGNIHNVIQILANIRNVDVTDICEITAQNTDRLFKLRR